MRLEQLFSGIELSILKQTSTKAEMADLETIDRIKADVNMVKQIEERLDRLDRQF
jgi:hypothetical protein